MVRGEAPVLLKVALCEQANCVHFSVDSETGVKGRIRWLQKRRKCSEQRMRRNGMLDELISWLLWSVYRRADMCGVRVINIHMQCTSFAWDLAVNKKNKRKSAWFWDDEITAKRGISSRRDNISTKQSEIWTRGRQCRRMTLGTY